MAGVSLDQFRFSLQVIHLQGEKHHELAFVYWNSKRLSSPSTLQDDILVIMRRFDGSFYLEIGNLVHVDTLNALEEKLFAWAVDEGWFIQCD